MRVTPSNQSLILAGERLPVPSRGSALVRGAVDATLNGPCLQSVTLLASQPDNTVLMLRAEYGSAEASGSSLVARTVSPRPGSSSSSMSSRPSFLQSPTEQYAQIQDSAGRGGRHGALDVLA